jgi:hypothetical protein
MKSSQEIIDGIENYIRDSGPDKNYPLDKLIELGAPQLIIIDAVRGGRLKREYGENESANGRMILGWLGGGGQDEIRRALRASDEIIAESRPIRQHDAKRPRRCDELAALVRAWDEAVAGEPELYRVCTMRNWINQELRNAGSLPLDSAEIGAYGIVCELQSPQRPMRRTWAPMPEDRSADGSGRDELIRRCKAEWREAVRIEPQLARCTSESAFVSQSLRERGESPLAKSEISRFGITS